MASTMRTRRNKRAAINRVSQKAQIRQMINGRLESLTERKIHTLATGSTISSAAGTIIPITQSLVQGDNITNRSGDKVTMKSLKVKLQFQLNVLSNSQTIRYILFADTMANRAVPAVTDVIVSATVTSLYEPINLLKRRFHVFADITKTLVLTAQSQAIHLDLSFKKEMPIYFGDPGNVAVANSKNALFMLVVTDATSNAPSFAVDHQMEYYDI